MAPVLLNNTGNEPNPQPSFVSVQKLIQIKQNNNDFFGKSGNLDTPLTET